MEDPTPIEPLRGADVGIIEAVQIWRVNFEGEWGEGEGKG